MIHGNIMDMVHNNYYQYHWLYSAVTTPSPLSLKLTPNPGHDMRGRLYIASLKDTECADIPGVPIVPLQGVKDKTGVF